MLYEYFLERAASCRRSAEGANAWLSEASLGMAEMFDELAEDALIREFYRKQAILAEKQAAQQPRRARPATARPNGPRRFWRRLLTDQKQPGLRVSELYGVKWA